MPNTYLVPAREGEQPELQLIAIVADGGEIIPVTDGPGMNIVTIGETPESEHTATPPATRTGGQSTPDCAWCGDGEGICQPPLDALLAQSLVLAVTGEYRARDDGNSQARSTPPQAVESEAEQDDYSRSAHHPW